MIGWEVKGGMAPEVGLEPTTTRLTVACSTIELLWNQTGAQSTNPHAHRQTDSTRNLAVWTVKRAPRRLHDAFYGATALHARLARAVINLQTFLIIIQCPRRAAKVKQPVRFAAD